MAHLHRDFTLVPHKESEHPLQLLTDRLQLLPAPAHFKHPPPHPTSTHHSPNFPWAGLYTTLSLHEDHPFEWQMMVPFFCPMISPVPHYCKVSSVHPPSQLVLETEAEFPYVSEENPTWKCCQEWWLVFFPPSLVWNPNTKTVTLTGPLPSWCKWFSTIDLGILSMWPVSRVASRGLSSVNIWTWWLSTATGLFAPGASSREKPPARNAANHSRHVRSVMTPSRTCHKSFLLFTGIFTLLEIPKPKVPKILLMFIHLKYENGHTNTPQFWWVFLNSHWYGICHDTV